MATILCFKMFSGHCIIAEANAIMPIQDDVIPSDPVGYRIRHVRVLTLKPSPQANALEIVFMPYLFGAANPTLANSTEITLLEGQFHLAYHPDAEIEAAYSKEINS
jgi:hypothetical protein